MSEELKKILAGVGILGAFALGGSAIAGAQSGNPVDKPASAQTEAGENGDVNEKVTGANADRAGRAALQSIGSGKVVSVERETPEAGVEENEAGDKPDSAEEQAIDGKTAYSVEVQTSDGKTVDVALDDAFNVLSSEQDTE